MGRQKSAPLLSGLKMVANGMDWQQAFLANPGCGTWATFRRAAIEQQSDADAAAAAAEPDPPPPPETAARPAPKRTQADTAASHRTGPKVSVETHQTQVAQSNERAWWKQYCEAHMAATTEYCRYVKANKRSRWLLQVGKPLARGGRRRVTGRVGWRLCRRAAICTELYCTGCLYGRLYGCVPLLLYMC